MPITSSLVSLLSTALFLWSHVDGASLEEFSTQRIKPTTPQLLPYSTASASLNSLAGHAGLGQRSSFRYANGNVRTSAKGIKRVRLIQTYAGYDVFGSAAEAEMDNNDAFSGQMYGEIVRNLHRDIPNPEACQRKVKSLQNLAIRLKRFRPSDPNIMKLDTRRIIYAGTGSQKVRLAYKIQFLYMNENYATYPVYFFDACTGLVLLSYDQIQNMTDQVRGQPANDRPEKSYFRENRNAACPVSAVGVGGNEKIGRITYNSVPFCLNVQRTFTTCRMEGTYSKVIDNQGSGQMNKQTVVTFPCSFGYNDAVNGGFGVANDALYYGEISGRFFEEKYGIRALSHTPRLVVHFRRAWENAIWDGRDMYFGDGQTFFHPLASLGVIAHELSHGVTTSNSDLVYRGMSGGINEAFSDITAETTEYFAQNSVDWLVGAEVTKSTAPIEALRFFRDPTRDGRSIKHVLGFRPFMDVHYSSGVYNHAFYRMVETEGMDIYDAYKCFLDANLNLWTPFTNFFAGACNVMQAAYDNGFSHRKVRRAFWRVGIPLIFCNYAALTTSMYVGESRNDILVSSTRSPILKVELDGGIANSTTVRVVSDDNTNVHVILGEDNEAVKVLARGDNAVTVGTSHSLMYVKLMSDSPTDIKVTMSISV